MAQNPNDNNKQTGLSWSAPKQTPPPPAQTQPKPQPPAPKPVQAKISPSTIMGNNSNAAKLTGWVAVGIVAGVVLAWGITAALNHKGSPTTAGALQSATSTNDTAGNAGLTVASPQKAGASVAVSGVDVSVPTWVVVYENRAGKPGNVLGAALFFAGSPSGTVELLRNTVAGQAYFVTEQEDNGDHRFSLKSDTLVSGSDGQPVWVSFTAN